MGLQMYCDCEISKEPMNIDLPRVHNYELAFTTTSFVSSGAASAAFSPEFIV